MTPRETKFRRRLRCLSALNFFGLVILWPLQNFVAESFWPVTMLVIAPPLVFALPALLLGVLALRRRQREIFALQIPALVFWFAAFSGFCLPLSAPAKIQNNKAISAMTFNIRSGSLGIEKVALIIKTQKPGVVFLQEAEAHGAYSDPIPILKKSLQNYQVARHDELAIFSRFPIAQKKYHSLPRHQIGVLEARLNIQGKPLTVLCAHFSNPLNGGPRNWFSEISLMADFRSAQADLLIQAASRAGTPVIIGGDFNLPPRGALYRRLRAQFADAFAARGLGFGNTFPAFFPLQRIDYFWTKNGAQVSSIRVLKSRASDHRALAAQVEMP